MNVLALVAGIVAIVLGLVDEFQARFVSLVGWAVVAAGIGVVLLSLGSDLVKA